MEITQKVNVNTTAKAILRDGHLSVEIAMAVPYGTKGRTATTTDVITDPEALRPLADALAALTQKSAESLLPRAQAAAQEAMSIAVHKREE